MSGWQQGRSTRRRASGRAVRLGPAVALVAALAILGAAQPAGAQTEPRFDALVFSKTTGFRHTAAIDAGRAAIRELAAERNFRVDETEDSSQFSEQNLARYDVVVMLHPDGQNVLTDPQEIAFERYVQRGGGVVGIHAASNMNRDWPWWQDLLGGALFANHPPIQTATMHVEDHNHPATEDLRRPGPGPRERWRPLQTWEWTDEWYNFTADPRDKGVHVLLSVDETTYEGGTMGEGHPISWCSNFDGGRTFYTAIGHMASHYDDELFRSHLVGAIEWAAGARESRRRPTSCPGRERAGIPSDSSFDKVTLDAGTENPMELAVAPDLSVYYVELAGAVKVWEPETAQTRVIGNIPVHRGNENGLLGLALDPDFATNRHLYVFYSAPPQEGPTGFQHVSRFTLGADGDLDMSSERVLLRIPHQRLICCHSAGSLAFGPGGELFISTGDDTTPFETSSFAPIDDDVPRNNVPGDPTNDANRAYDARRTSGNTNDLRGKILRIIPKDDPTGPPGPGSTYDIPAGNLFPPFESDPTRTRPEIYTMGHRNPFRIAVDQETGWLYNGEVGPDANNDSATRGPRGYDELNQIRAAGNMGWPYCIANDWRTPDPNDSFAYRDWTYPSGPAGDAFDCSGAAGGGPVNTSRYNTGLTQTPPAKPAMLYWPYTPYQADFPRPDIPGGGGRTAIAGPTYHFQAGNPAENKFPDYYDRKVFFADWSRDWIATATLDAEGMPVKVDRFMGNTRFRAPQDMAMGPDGSLYLLEWGEAFNFAGGGINRDSGLYRIDYAQGKRTPVARAAADRDSGPAPLTVSFSSEGTHDLDGDDITLQWNFGDGSTSTESNPTHTYTEVGSYTAQLRVADSTGKVGTATLTIHAGNTRPAVRIEFPEDGGFIDWGDQVAYHVAVTDPEDATIACDRVEVQLGVLHDAGGGASHIHPGTTQTGCEGTFDTQPDPGHDAGALLMQVVTARYTDTGGQPGSQPLEGGVTHRLWPKTIQAEHFADQLGLSIADNNTARGFFRVQSVTVGDWMYFEPMNFRNIDQLSVRYSSGSTAGGRLELRVDQPDGPVIASLELAPTSGGNTYNNAVAPIAPTTGTHRVYVTFAQRPGGPTNNLFNLDELTFVGQGVGNP
jgi:cytochrome c